eukprot:TRINITY_DN4829_c0_g2_i2.p1 TRINITY_DN4829_c0_g2~~TRINITY_DN4829_c0_g2_i2.p1  ORF type:complete len:1239 (-),score=210.12 TRINITY_DN4829_c0_g2_i2:67-3783(-)
MVMFPRTLTILPLRQPSIVQQDDAPMRPTLTKTQQKKLDHMRAKKKKKQARAQLLEDISRTATDSNTLSLLRSSRGIGGKETAKQKLSRALGEERVGIAQSTDARLYKRNQEHTMTDGSHEKAKYGTGRRQPLPESEDDDSGSSDSSIVNFLDRQGPVTNLEANAEEGVTRDDHGDDHGHGDAVIKDHEKSSPDASTGLPAETVSKAEGDATITDRDNQADSAPPIRKTSVSIRKDYDIVEQGLQRGEEIGKIGTAPDGSTLRAFNKLVVQVDRTPEIDEARRQLPIYAEEQVIMDAIVNHPVTVLCGETGSGKTTQIPQFLYEAGAGRPGSDWPGMVAVTQPRRVATASMSRRVAEELACKLGEEVGYQIRFEGRHSDKTIIKFMTDGVLLKEIQSDFLLTRYSVILIDEAHERNLYTDVLLGLLSRIVPLRAELVKEGKKGPDGQVLTPLKLVIMSATLRVDDFAANVKLFPTRPPVVHVPARQFPVITHFSKRTPIGDAFNATLKKVCSIHRRLPPGGVLVFMTGKQEIETLCAQLRSKFPAREWEEPEGEASDDTADSDSERYKLPGEEVPGEEVETAETLRKDAAIKQQRRGTRGPDDQGAASSSSSVSIGDEITLEQDDQQDDVEDSDKHGEEEDDEEQFDATEVELDVGPLHVVPLYSALNPNEQLKAFQPPPPGHRLVVVATNVAETSITVPGVKYVVDCGLQKTRSFRRGNGLSKFEVTWVSKASANQRQGRAGRVSAGHCYRLYSSAVFDNQFPSFSEPEILRIPIEGMVLQVKSMGISDLLEFPFPTPPDRSGLRQALRTLHNLGAVTSGAAGGITKLGSAMALFPIAPRFAKMLTLGEQAGCMPYVIAIVAILSVHEPFLRESQLSHMIQAPVDGEDDGDEGGVQQARSRLLGRARKSHQAWANAHSDILTTLRAVGAYEYEKDKEFFCKDKFLSSKVMKEIRQLRLQLSDIVAWATKETELEVATEGSDHSRRDSFMSKLKLKPPTADQEHMLRQVTAAGFIDQVARRRPPGDDVQPGEYQGMYTDEPLFLHPTSVLFQTQPEFVVYSEVIETSKAFMRGVTEISPAWLTSLAGAANLVGSVARPLDDPEPRYRKSADDVIAYASPTFGPRGWTLPLQKISYPRSMEERYRHFARALLEGRVFKPLEVFFKNNMLTGKPVWVTKSWTLAKIPAITTPLMEKKISTRAELEQEWKGGDPQFLLRPYLEWVKEAGHEKVKAIWPPIQ